MFRMDLGSYQDKPSNCTDLHALKEDSQCRTSKVVMHLDCTEMGHMKPSGVVQKPGIIFNVPKSRCCFFFLLLSFSGPSMHWKCYRGRPSQNERPGVIILSHLPTLWLHLSIL